MNYYQSIASTTLSFTPLTMESTQGGVGPRHTILRQGFSTDESLIRRGLFRCREFLPSTWFAAPLLGAECAVCCRPLYGILRLLELVREPTSSWKTDLERVRHALARL